MPREYKAGRPLKSTNGYIRIWQPQHPLAFKDGTVLMHRKIWFDNYGEIPKGYHIHHKNKDKTDNRIDNLELVTSSQHQVKHTQTGMIIKNQFGTHTVKPLEERISYKTKRKLEYRECKNCGADYNNKRIDAVYCSKRCQIANWKHNKKLSAFPPS